MTIRLTFWREGTKTIRSRRIFSPRKAPDGGNGGWDMGEKLGNRSFDNSVVDSIIRDFQFATGDEPQQAHELLRLAPFGNNRRAQEFVCNKIVDAIHCTNGASHFAIHWALSTILAEWLVQQPRLVLSLLDQLYYLGCYGDEETMQHILKTRIPPAIEAWKASASTDLARDVVVAFSSVNGHLAQYRGAAMQAAALWL
jgi:hypothetical protein